MTTECFNCYKPLDECTCGRTETFETHDGPACPFCGYLNSASDSDGLLFSEDTTEYDCGQCGREFDVDVAVSFSWRATRPETEE